MKSLNELLQEKIQRYSLEKEEAFSLDKKEFEKKFNQAVKAFQVKINKDREMPISFIAVRTKLEHIKDIGILRWFYGNCLKYSRKKGNTFGKCFFGSLK